MGGYIAGDRPLIDMIRNYASGFIFTTSLPPHVLAAARKAIDILASEEGRQLRAQHQYVVCTVKSLLQQEGIPVINCPSHIIPIHVNCEFSSVAFIVIVFPGWSPRVVHAPEQRAVEKAQHLRAGH